MTTLYRPVLIESAEQAEALSALTPYMRVYENEVAGQVRPVTTHAGLVGDVEPGELIFGPPFREFALVPIEAEEETQGIATWPRPDDAPWPKRSQLCSDSSGDYYYRDEDGVAHDITEEMTGWLAAQPVRTRLATPWEEA